MYLVHATSANIFSFWSSYCCNHSLGTSRRHRFYSLQPFITTTTHPLMTVQTRYCDKTTMSSHGRPGRLISSLTRLVRRLRTSTPIPENTAPLTRIPAELFDLITEDLNLETLFLLSEPAATPASSSTATGAQSSKRPTPASACASSSRSGAPKWPDYVACARCRKLHPIDLNDTPEHPTYSRRGCLDARSCHCVRNESRAHLEYVIVPQPRSVGAQVHAAKHPR